MSWGIKFSKFGLGSRIVFLVNAVFFLASAKGDFMASKENLYNIGRILLAGSALTAAAFSVEQRSQNQGQSQSQSQSLEVRGLVLTDSEIAQMRDYDGYIAAAAKIEPTEIVTVLSTPVTIAIPEKTYQKPQIVEKLPVVQMIAEGAQLIDKYKSELPDILIIINADGQQTEDLQIYYPIYRAAQDRFGVPWELIWIIHEAESNISRNGSAYECNIHCGPMQRSVAYHPQEDVNRANVGLEYLQNLPVRHFDDAAEIVWAAAAIDEWAGLERDYQKALLKYSARGPAQERFQRFLESESLLGQ